MGALFEELSAMAAAEKAFRKACEVAPEEPAGYAALADLLVRYERNPPEAVTLARFAVDQSPTPQNWALLSAAYLNNGENAAALAAIQEALRLAPQSASYRAVFDSIKRDL
jgi:cytochrome c-type biogenesis protein CcmH/NrfG